MEITCLAVPKCSVGEGPVWDVQSASLFWIDILEKRVHRLSLDGQTASWAVPQIIGSMAIRRGGGGDRGARQWCAHAGLRDRAVPVAGVKSGSE
jgi:sugar lactone lactonase YvrE